MDAIRELEAEHRGIERMLAIMQGVSDRLFAEEQVDPGHLEQIGEFIRVFADRCHHGKEEGLLFPAMEQAGIPREGGPIGVMLVEHNAGRAFVGHMQQATTAYIAGELEGRVEWARNALGYISLLRSHIAKEDQILYPMAERVLSADQDRVLVKGFERIEAEEVGPGRHEAFHHLLDKLGQIYAPARKGPGKRFVTRTRQHPARRARSRSGGRKKQRLAERVSLPHPARPSG